LAGFAATAKRPTLLSDFFQPFMTNTLDACCVMGNPVAHSRSWIHARFAELTASPSATTALWCRWMALPTLCASLPRAAARAAM
jgi:hypothetical protein